MSLARCLVGCACLLTACTSEEVGAGHAPLAAAQPGELILDLRADGAALFGAPLPVPADADPDRVLALRAEPQDLAPELQGREVLDARFVDGGFVVLGADHVLRSSDGRALDEAVYGPLAVAGASVAYVRGEPPSLEVARLDVRTGAVEALAEGLAPTWNPALAPDGTLYVVSGATGGPQLLRIDERGVEVVPAERVPASSFAPRVIDGALVFEDEAGAVWLDLSSGQVRRATQGRAHLVFTPSGEVLERPLVTPERIPVGEAR